MKDKHLLSLMFDDAADFRAQLLEGTLRTVRRRRRVRRCAQVLATVALLAAVVWWTLPRHAAVERPPGAVVEVITTGQTSVEVVSTSTSRIEIVEDEELLELVPGETKLLVWHAPHQAELVILDGGAP